MILNNFCGIYINNMYGYQKRNLNQVTYWYFGNMDIPSTKDLFKNKILI